MDVLPENLSTPPGAAPRRTPQRPTGGAVETTMREDALDEREND